MNKKNKILSVSSILSLLICLFAAIVVWLFAKYDIMSETQAVEAAVSEFFSLIV